LKYFLLSDITQKVSNGKKNKINKNKQDFPYYQVLKDK